MLVDTGKCRFCDHRLVHSFVDLGMSPLSNAYIRTVDLKQKESFYPLHAYVCHHCFLVQLEEFESPEHIFSEYVYFSSYSNHWLRHAKEYADRMISSSGYHHQSQVIEIASNDGYLLQYFKAQGIPVFGIEPAANVAAVAEQKGIPTLVAFFGVEIARELVAKGKQADLIVGNNVLAHVPNIHDFVKGLKLVLKPDGVITMEFPHLLKLMQQNQFDTIYHEHFSYFSLGTVENIFAFHGLSVFDAEELPTHGGSLRIYARHKEDESKPKNRRVADLIQKEADYGLRELGVYRDFQRQVEQTKREILQFFITAKQQKKTVVGYGAPAKGNTLLNYCGIRTDLMAYTVDRNPHKQGMYLPGTHIPIMPLDTIRETKPDYLFILPWNLKDEIMDQTGYIREWNGKFVVPIPRTRVLDS